MPHDFQESLEYSHSASDKPFWREIYEKAFTDMVAMVDHRQDGEHQRAGIDRSIVLANSKQILVDEKCRRRAYRDIALEYLSDEARKVPGWVCKPLRADYIAYAIEPTGKCYLLPVIQLQKAWTVLGEAWIKKYKRIEALNKSWRTISVGVPPEVLLGAISQALQFRFTPYHEPAPKEAAPINGSTWDDFQRDAEAPF